VTARTRLWTDLGCALLLVVIGCKSTQPDLRPPKQPDVLYKPPDEARYNSPAYPKQALAQSDDPTKKWNPSGAGGGSAMPSRGMGGGGMGGGGMGGGGMGGGGMGGGGMGGMGR
jgi:hypothetical protein